MDSPIINLVKKMADGGTNNGGAGAKGDKSLCIVTGASRGLGRALALEIGKAFGGKFDYVLVARV